MKICFITFEYPPKILGGLGVYAEELVKGLSAKNIDVTTISRGDRTQFDEKVFRVSIPNVQYWRRLFFINRARSLFTQLNKIWKFDVVHLNGAYPMIQKFGVPTVCTFHSVNFPQIQASLRAIGGMKSKEEISDIVLKNTVGCFSDIESVRLSDKIICPSPVTAMELQRWCFANADRIRIIPNGINLEAFDSVKASDITLLNRYGVESDNYFLFMGRLVFLKGVDSLIRAFKIIQSTHKELKLVIVGKGPFEAYLKKIAAGIPGVIFTGHIDNPAARKLLYDNSLALFVPSFHEVLPTVIIEAMACSKPIIATNVGGNPFMIKHGKNGFLVEARDSEGIANFMKLLYENCNLRKSLGKFGRNLMEKEFVIGRTVGQTAKVYESLLRST